MRDRYLANDQAREKERLISEVVNMVGLVDPGMGYDAVCVCADGGLDVVLARGENAGEG